MPEQVAIPAERHTLNIYAKLGVRSRAEAVAVAYAGTDRPEDSA